MENELFDKKTKQEIMIAPMRDYIEEWLRKDLVKIIETYQHEAVAMVIPPPTQQQPPTKYISTRKGL